MTENTSNETLEISMQNDENSLSGYLSKKTRDGRWQKRWFETNGLFD